MFRLLLFCRYRADPESLGAERVAELKALGFDFDPHSSRWEKRFAMLLQFRKETGHTQVPAKCAAFTAIAVAAAAAAAITLSTEHAYLLTHAYTHARARTHTRRCTKALVHAYTHTCMHARAATPFNRWHKDPIQ